MTISGASRPVAWTSAVAVYTAAWRIGALPGFAGVLTLRSIDSTGEGAADAGSEMNVS
jgi:hypothetical protein